VRGRVLPRVILASVLTALGVAPSAHAQEIVAFGDRYRFTAVNSTFGLAPELPFASRKAARALTHDELLARSDEFAALALKTWGMSGPGAAGFVRDRVETANGFWVIYSQRHQGYPIYGTGGRIELDACGRALFCGLSYAAEKLRDFRPRDSTALERIAASAVRHAWMERQQRVKSGWVPFWEAPRVGWPVEQGMMIQHPGGSLSTAPAELDAWFVYGLSSDRGRMHEGWQVVLNAETGKVVDSSSTTRQ